jgi:hypothetical protein
MVPLGNSASPETSSPYLSRAGSASSTRSTRCVGRVMRRRASFGMLELYQGPSKTSTMMLHAPGYSQPAAHTNHIGSRQATTRRSQGQRSDWPGSRGVLNRRHLQWYTRHQTGVEAAPAAHKSTRRVIFARFSQRAYHLV